MFFAVFLTAVIDGYERNRSRYILDSPFMLFLSIEESLPVATTGIFLRIPQKLTGETISEYPEFYSGSIKLIYPQFYLGPIF